LPLWSFHILCSHNHKPVLSPFIILNLFSSNGRETKKTRLQKKLRLLQEVLIDLGLAHLRSRAFAIAFLQIFLCAWMRLYLHSLAQWIYLYLLNRPVTNVAILPYALAFICSYSLCKSLFRYQVIIAYSFTSSTLPVELVYCVIGRYETCPTSILHYFMYEIRPIVVYQ
jgi:hypothetical protein